MFFFFLKKDEEKQGLGAREEDEKEKKWKNFLDGNLSNGRLPIPVFVPGLFLIGRILFLGCVYGVLGRQGLRKVI
jgi:hypothetical protein